MCCKALIRPHLVIDLIFKVALFFVLQMRKLTCRDQPLTLTYAAVRRPWDLNLLTHARSQDIPAQTQGTQEAGTQCSPQTITKTSGFPGAPCAPHSTPRWDEAISSLLLRGPRDPGRGGYRVTRARRVLGEPSAEGATGAVGAQARGQPCWQLQLPRAHGGPGAARCSTHTQLPQHADHTGVSFLALMVAFIPRTSYIPAAPH